MDVAALGYLSDMVFPPSLPPVDGCCFFGGLFHLLTAAVSTHPRELPRDLKNELVPDALAVCGGEAGPAARDRGLGVAVL